MRALRAYVTGATRRGPGLRDRDALQVALQPGDGLVQVRPSEPDPEVIAGMPKRRSRQKEHAFRLDQLG